MPEAPPPSALLLAPGAGAGRDHSCLVAIEDLVEGDPDLAGRLAVARMDFPYRKAGRRAPDRPPVLLAAVREEAAALAEAAGVDPARVVCGGRSMGGRMCSMAVAEGMAALGLVLISYPLHPPGRPDQLRTEHLGRIGVPCLFVSGTRDAFGTPAELESAASAIPAPVTHVWIEGGDHGLRRHDARVAAEVCGWLRGLVVGPGPRG